MKKNDEWMHEGVVHGYESSAHHDAVQYHSIESIIHFSVNIGNQSPLTVCVRSYRQS